MTLPQGNILGTWLESSLNFALQTGQITSSLTVGFELIVFIFKVYTK
jgi:hypothetical protein